MQKTLAEGGDRFHPRGGREPVDSLHLHGLNAGDYLPARVAWQLGLTGPTVAVGAACATSLVAIHLAVDSLLAEECDTALAGGVSLRLPQEQGYLSIPDGPFSRDGHTRSYGAGATGTVFTQGAGVVVLRRLSDALADGDPIRAVVMGTAIGNDGPDRVAFSAPSVSGQVRVVAEALAVAGVDPHQLGLIEGHGTGTRLGDPIEGRRCSPRKPREASLTGPGRCAGAGRSSRASRAPLSRCRRSRPGS